MGFLPPAGEAVAWQTLHQPVRTFQFKWTVLDVSPSPEEDNPHYCKHTESKKNKTKTCSVNLSPLAVSFFSAGLDFGAILVKPSSSSSEARLPLVVFIHGLRTLAVCLLTRGGACELTFDCSPRWSSLSVSSRMEQHHSWTSSAGLRCAHG